MKRFIKKILLFGLIFFIYDKIFYIVILLSPQTEVDERLELLINGNVNKDIVILGSSRGARDIIAAQIEHETGLSAYNLCYPGSNIEFHEFILRTLVKFNSPPKLALFVMDDYSELLNDETIVFRLDRLYPLIKYPYIKEELIRRGEKNKYLSRFFILHKINIRNLDLRKKKFSQLDTIMNCGSMPISFQREGRKWIYDSSERIYPIDKEDKNRVGAFENCMKILDQYNIKVLIVFPPNFQIHSKSFENRIRQLTGTRANFYIYNYENPLYINKDHFHDESHLLQESAVVFTSEVISYLKELN